jgi:putative ABC transport system permease protein
MSVDLLERPAPAVASAGKDNGGVPARRAMVRWAWRLFRREWRQQLLILALVAFAIAATVVGATVATTTPAPANFGFGTAQDQAVYQGYNAKVAADIARFHAHFGPVDVIANQTITIPGTINSYDLRAQNPHGPYGQPMLSLLSGHYPKGPGEVAITPGLASTLNLKVGDTLGLGGAARHIVGIVQNPQSLLDEFALVVPGQVKDPSQVTVLFDAGGAKSSLLDSVETPASVATSNPLNPETIVLALATLGMLLIALVSVGGFTVLAQRRLRSIGMLGSLGATDKNIRLVVRANGLVVGVVGTALGAGLGFVAWAAYRPHAEASSHHLIALFALPWLVIGISMALAIVATFLAASRPARSVTKVPIVAALSGRPAPPKQVHRSAVPGVIAGVIAFFLIGAAGSSHGGNAGPLILGLVALIVAIILLSPLFLAVLSLVARHAPVTVRLAVRDLVRYRARSGSALAAISLGVLIAVMICVLAASRYGNVLDYAGPNMASNQMIVYTPGSNPSGGQVNGSSASASAQVLKDKVDAIASALDSQDTVELDSTNANLQHTGTGRQFSGAVYVATPQLLKSFGITSSDYSPSADVLSARPGLSGVSGMQLLYGNGGGGSKSISVSPGQGPGPGFGGNNTNPCDKGSCVNNPPIDEVSGLPAGTSAPNTVITEHAVHEFHLSVGPSGWFIQASHPLTAADISNARQAAASVGMSIETKDDQPSSSQIIDWATLVGIVLALGVLAMTVGLIRSETASDLRILTASGASSSTRRSLTAATAGALGLLGALLGTVAAYVACIGYARTSALDGLSSLENIPLKNLGFIIIGMPLLAAVVGWLLAGREPPSIARQPME